MVGEAAASTGGVKGGECGERCSDAESRSGKVSMPSPVGSVGVGGRIEGGSGVASGIVIVVVREMVRWRSEVDPGPGDVSS